MNNYDKIRDLRTKAGSAAIAEAIQKGHTPRFYKLRLLVALCENILKGREQARSQSEHAL